MIGLAEAVARIVALLALFGVSLWCLYGYVTAVLVEAGWRPAVGWLLGLAASRLAAHSVAQVPT